MKHLYGFLCANVVITVYFGSVCGQDLLSSDHDEDQVDKRKVFKSDMLYTLHVQKLREVNGLKTHNLEDAEPSRLQKPLIYINNPVESKMPNAYLTIAQFKNSMVERVEKQKREFEKFSRNKLLINTNKKFKPFKHDIIIINRGNTKYEKRYTNPTSPPNELLFDDMYEMPIDSFTNEVMPSIHNGLSQSHDKSFDISDETDRTTDDVTTTTESIATTVYETSPTIKDVEESTTEGYNNTDATETTVTDEPSTDTIDVETATDVILNETTTELVIDFNKTTLETKVVSMDENSTETTIDDNTTPTIFYETTTETVVDEQKETTDTVEDETTTELVIDFNKTTIETSIKPIKENSTETTMDDNTTPTIFYETTTDTVEDEKKETTDTVEEETTTESNKDEEYTEAIVDEETTEAIEDETTTTPKIVTTTKGPPKRTKRPRPFVFMGES